MLNSGYQPENEGTSFDKNNPPTGGSGLVNSRDKDCKVFFNMCEHYMQEGLKASGIDGTVKFVLNTDYGKPDGDKTAECYAHKNTVGQTIIDKIIISVKEPEKGIVDKKVNIEENYFGTVEQVNSLKKPNPTAEPSVNVPLQLLQNLKHDMKDFLEKMKNVPAVPFSENHEPEITTLKEMLRKAIRTYENWPARKGYWHNGAGCRIFVRTTRYYFKT